MEATIDIDALLADWAQRTSATASLLAVDGEQDLDEAIGLFVPPPASREMRREFLKLAFRDARALLASDDLLTGAELLRALNVLSFMERFALYRAGGELPAELACC
jgi:hypothetical protein